MRRHHALRGFTLIELIVVILILGILATIGTVAYSYLTERARVSAGMANLRQVAMATTADLTLHQADELSRAGMLEALEPLSVDVVDGGLSAAAQQWTLYGKARSPKAAEEFAVGFDDGEGTTANDVDGTRAVVLTSTGKTVLGRILVFGTDDADGLDGRTGEVAPGTTPQDVLENPDLLLGDKPETPETPAPGEPDEPSTPEAPAGEFGSPFTVDMSSYTSDYTGKHLEEVGGQAKFTDLPAGTKSVKIASCTATPEIGGDGTAMKTYYYQNATTVEFAAQFVATAVYEKRAYTCTIEAVDASGKVVGRKVVTASVDGIPVAPADAPTPKLTRTDDGWDINWDQVEDADKYEISWSTSMARTTYGTNQRGGTYSPDGTLYITADGWVDKIAQDGVVTDLAGMGQYGLVDAQGRDARFGGSLSNAAIDAGGNVFVTDGANHAIRKIDAGGNVTTVVGGTAGKADGTKAVARLNGPNAILLDSNGDLIVSDSNNYRIVRITQAGTVSTIASTTGSYVKDIALAPDGTLYWASSSAVYKVSGSTSTLVAGGSGQGTVNGAATSAKFQQIEAIVFKGSTLYIADLYTIRVLNGSTVSTLAGDPTRTSRVDGTGSAAGFSMNQDIDLNPKTGNLMVTDLSGIRSVTPGGVVKTVTMFYTGTSTGTYTNWSGDDTTSDVWQPDDLDPEEWTTVEVKVRAGNDVGWGPWSQLVTDRKDG